MCPVTAVRVAYTGELGWELHHPIEMQNYLFDRLFKAGKEFNLKLVGARAQNWLRQEKSYRAFGTELGRDATPLEAGLSRFIDLTKHFFGKEALEKQAIRSKCVTILFNGPKDSDPWGREAIYVGGKKIGRLTSGGYSVHFKCSIGMGYVLPEHANLGEKVQIKMLNELWNAEIVEDSPYDPKNEKIRLDG
jgi:dimethylglycine dehydrogenase